MHRSVILMASILVALVFSAGRWPIGRQAGIDMAQWSCDPDTAPPVIVYPSQDIAVQLSPCDGSQTAVVFFDAVANDACDPAPNLSINVSASAGSDLQLSNPFQNTYMALATPGVYQLILTATDASGNSREEDFFIIVSQPEAPVADVACNADVVVNLGPGCQRYVSPDMLLTGALGCLSDAHFRIQIQDSDPSNGNILDDVGVYPFSIEPIQPLNATRFTGPFALSNWGVHVDFQGSVTTSMAADSIVLRGSNSLASAVAVLPLRFGGALSFKWGTATLPPGALFEGHLFGPAGNMITSFSSADGSSGLENLFVSAGSRLVLQLLSAGQSGGGVVPAAWLTNWGFDFDPVSLAGAPSCWGQINARDAGPVLDCPDDADRVARGTIVQQLEGALDSTSPLLNTALHSCLIDGLSPNGDRYYELIPFEVDQADIFTFFLDAGFDQGDAQIALFQGSFDLNNPCGNIIAQANDPQVQNPIGGSNGPILRVALPLRPGQQYFLLTTSDVPGATGPYTYTAVSDSAGQILGVPDSSIGISYPLYCDDITLALDGPESLALFGVPEVQGGCTDFTLTFADGRRQTADGRQKAATFPARI